MPAASTSTSHPQCLSTTAVLIHRIRHSLRARRNRHPPVLTSPSPHVGVRSNRNLPRLRRGRVETPRSQSVPRELPQIDDRGEYAQHRYTDMDVYWNSVMLEANEQDNAQRIARNEDQTRSRTGDQVPLLNTEEPHNAHHRFSNQDSSPPAIASPAPPAPPQSHLTNPSPIHFADNTTTQPPSPHPNSVLNTLALTLTPILTWNTALSLILSNPLVPTILASSVRARARGRRLSRDENAMDMCAVGLVPNFSYPVAGARWYDAGLEDVGEVVGSSSSSRGRVMGDGNSLYRVLTPVSMYVSEMWEEEGEGEGGSGVGLGNGLEGVVVDGEFQLWLSVLNGWAAD